MYSSNYIVLENFLFGQITYFLSIICKLEIQVHAHMLSLGNDLNEKKKRESRQIYIKSESKELFCGCLTFSEGL